MKKLWEKLYYSQWFKPVMMILTVIIAFVILSIVGTLLNVWFTHFMKDVFNINVYWTI